VNNLFQPVDKDPQVLIGRAGREDRRSAALWAHVPEKPRSLCRKGRQPYCRQTKLT